MKVILTRDVAKIGRRGEVVEVPDGYAFNKLIPTKSAMLATPANIKQVAVAKERKEHNVEVLHGLVGEAIKSFKDKPLVIKVKANDQGHLFQAVSANVISTEAKTAGVEISEEYIVLKSPIKNIGDYEVEVKVSGKSFPLLIKVISN